MVYLPHMPASAGADTAPPEPQKPVTSLQGARVAAVEPTLSPYSYRPAGVLTTLVIALFALYLFVTGAVLFADWQQMTMLNEMSNGADVTAGQMLTSEMMQGIASLISLGLYIPLIIVFCMWIYRANRNAQALVGEELTVSPGWTVGWFFIPIMNLFKPYQAAKEIWQASQPGAGSDWKSAPVSSIVHAWWAMWIISGLVGGAAGRMTWGAESMESYALASQVHVAADALTIVAGVLALLFVRGIYERQQAGYRVTAGEPTFSPPVSAQQAA